MNIVKSASLPVPYAAEQSPRTISAWLDFFLFELISWYFGHNNAPPQIIRYPTQRPDPANLDWPQNTEAQEALEVLRREFSHSSIGGLMRLGKAISRGFVPGTDWDDSILSFRLGFHGSAIKDSEDQTENAFTIYWRGHQREIDPEWLLFEIRAKL
ncbi:hypothetical protein A3H65_01140 [Candidatus Giovannonibacteria bacterium RIFCSPLOWO2_02_FULL_45_14]|uniref:Uncharacterized protein n=1 Tax=Candidatus Giovannonibacteria bacterium RIFCSPLOWO2_12_FULL_44_15 TaxID=1798364 RepID=A0A1F5XZW0_9BACT|nr:MAG: hypothetical protein A3C75_01320 [Candidatus Giovannonibacteria bacterium RIFCSPHIGHO2_02_FULL_44_31]OGF76373.1 MAG: hypothetical protein A3E62_00520 [Candidatus Giovannonibacteria bacterium RIFCSPHIGHO2_12_FULL_44_29]OGF90945.1 MAG: hypothetical protein A3H65_01140 [Candidatus Giovannonibacteria bacterium RIFCSPLOWO2_02_FULL_45_14]OGF93464.1 MAG: hypothetical protein A3G54_04210 [Candidatus Giovannonibacteria bacterium RIFCSPLOWO2_12_FULL_44_15]